MISDYYHRQYSLQRINTKAIKLKNNQHTLQPFLIPTQHFHPNNEAYNELKDRCQKIKSQFSFIKNQIQRQHQKKKQKQQQLLRISKNLVDKQNRDSIQKQMSLTCKKLLKLHHFKKLNYQEIKNQKIIITQQKKFQPVKGVPVSFSPRNYSADKSFIRSLLKRSPIKFRQSLANQ